MRITTTTGMATRECEATGWGRAQLGECKGTWLSSIVASYRAAPTTSPHLSRLLRQKIATESLYGGDIISLFDLFESSARNFQFHTTSEGGNESSDVKELKNLLASLSALLENRSVAAWLDLAPIEFEFQRTRFIGILQELGLLALDASKLDTTLRTDNFGETDFHILDRGVIDVRLLSGFSVISLLQEGGAEGVKSGSDFSTISLGLTQFLKSLTRNSPRLVLLEVSKVDTLFSISDRQQLAQIEGEGDVLILSQVVSVFAKNVKNRYMSEGINITLKHLAVQKDVKKVRQLQFPKIFASSSQLDFWSNLISPEQSNCRSVFTGTCTPTFGQQRVQSPWPATPATPSAPSTTSPPTPSCGPGSPSLTMTSWPSSLAPSSLPLQCFLLQPLPLFIGGGSR